MKGASADVVARWIVCIYRKYSISDIIQSASAPAGVENRTTSRLA
jgi:hypothetical protein